MTASPTARSLDLLRRQGWTAGVVERHIQQIHVTIDLFGFIDLLALRDTSCLAVQATSRSNLAARVKKSAAAEHLPKWLAIPGHRFECWGWVLQGRAGTRKRWLLHQVAFSLDNHQRLHVTDPAIFIAEAPLPAV
jgi:hypothetical protein